MVLLDSTGKIIAIACVAADYLGRPPSDLLGRELASLCSASSAVELRAALAGVGVERGVPDFAVEFLDPAGGILSALLDLHPLSGAEGPLAWVQVKTVRETEAVRDLLKLAFVASPHAMLLVEASGAIAVASSVAERLLLYPPGTLAGSPVDVLVPEGVRSRHGSLRAGFLSHPSQRPMGEGRELFLVRRDGTTIPVEIGLGPIKTDSGTFVVVAIEDLSARKQLEARQHAVQESQQHALAEAESAARAKDEFLALLSHELRAPLNVILGWLDVLKAEGSQSVDLGHVLEILERNALRQAKLVAEVLDTSRIIQGRLELERSSCDLGGLIENVLVAVRPGAAARGVRLRRRVDMADPIVADTLRLEQVLTNLVSNAIKFTPPGGTVEVELTDVGSHLLLRVVDDGIGIAAEFLPKLFERFTQADSSPIRAHGGLGLGLSIVRHLVELHGGQVSGESPGIGKGSIFTVVLPRRPGEIAGVLPDRIVPGTRARLAAATPDLTGLRIVVVDDEADMRELLERSLPGFGAQVVSAGSVREALARIDEIAPDVLISDVSMPGQDGYALIRALRAREAGTASRLPAIALTAYAAAGDRGALLAAGFDAHLAKPVVPLDLARMVAELGPPH